MCIRDRADDRPRQAAHAGQAAGRGKGGIGMGVRGSVVGDDVRQQHGAQAAVGHMETPAEGMSQRMAGAEARVVKGQRRHGGRQMDVLSLIHIS